MRALILSSHPRADRAAHKADVLMGLVEREIDATVLYGGTRLRDYTGELRRRSPADVLKIVRRRSVPRSEGAGGDGGALRAAARELGVRIVSFPTLDDESALVFVRELQPHITLNMSALYIPPAFLEAAGNRVVGAHYAELPRIRGGDTIRWSILLDVPLCVSHQLLTGEFDMGDVVGGQPVEVARGDDLATLRRRCQQASVAGYFVVVEGIRSGTLERRRQRRSDGSTFFRMGSFLRAHVDELLRAGRYSHYSTPA